MMIIDEYLRALLAKGAEIQETDVSVDDATHCCRIAGLGYVAIVASEAVPGEWQLKTQFVEQLAARAKADGVACWYVFLIVRQDGRGANGYIVADFASSPVKRAFELSEDQYLIREKRHFDSLRLLLSTEKVADLLLRKRNTD